MPSVRPAIVLRPYLDLDERLADVRGPVTVGFGLDGSVHAVAARTRESPWNRRGWSPTAKMTYRRPCLQRVVSWDGARWHAVELDDEPTVVSFVQPHPEGWLLAAARCSAGPPPDRNALVVAPDGHVVRRFMLGDGLADVRVAPSGAVWAAYTDEGTLGNYGWGAIDPDTEERGPTPVGFSGLVRFDAFGGPTWSFEPSRLGVDLITEVYGLDLVGEDDLWLSPYQNFPLLHVRDGACRIRFAGGIAPELGARGLPQSVICSPTALVARGDRVWLVLGLHPGPTTVAEVRVGEGDVAPLVATYDLVDDQGAPWTGSCVGVGGRLWGVKGRTVWRVDDV